MSALQDLAARLAIPGLPEWTGLLALLVLLLTALAYLMMPFSVFGLKGRMEGLEAQLDEVQAEIRNLSLRLADHPRRPLSEDWVEPPGSRRVVAPEPPVRSAPPVPPPAAWPEPPPRSGRTEPRLDWPDRR